MKKLFALGLATIAIVAMFSELMPNASNSSTVASTAPPDLNSTMVASTAPPDLNSITVYLS